MTSLYAIYDLRVAPPSYDFAIFLQCAELQRKRYKIDTMEVWIIKGKRISKMPLSNEEGSMMLRNIVLPMCHLLPSITSIQLLPEGTKMPDVVPEYIYPLGYASEHPQPGFLMCNLLASIVRAEVPTNWTPPADALKLIDQYIELYPNKKIVTINLRENPDYPTRNSNLDEWKLFCEQLDKNIYQPVIVRETFKMYTPLNWHGCVEFPTAALDLCQRAALYNRAYINCFVANGPMALSMFSPSKTLIIKPIDENNNSTSRGWLENIQGFTVGGQLACVTQQHKYYWSDDSSEYIIRSFNDLDKEDGRLQWTYDIKHLTNTLCSHLKWRFNCIVAEEDVMLLNLLPFAKHHLEYIFQNNKQAFDLVYNQGANNGISDSR